jgi:50S ribosomal protein L16 3-hydroxylase
MRGHGQRPSGSLTMHVLGELSVAEFLRDYWQKKPLLIRNAWPDFQPLLTADELAGLSLEEEIESRIVMEHGKEGPWEILKGPFNDDVFADLPETHWTLLVQAVDHWIPEAADLMEHFRFLPRWRIDDLMISFAVDGGSVGPHYDQYDVFLLQAEGQREWRIGQMCSEQSDILDGPKIRVQKPTAGY